MLGTLSPGKILLLVIVIAVVVQLMRNSARSRAAAAGKPRRAVELTACPRCGVYLPKGSFCPGGPACGKR